jgi:hypothetical protein
MPYPDIDPTVVQWRIRSYLDVWEELLAHHRVRRPLVIGIDGHSGSGKTTLAGGLAALDRGTAVVHTDDLAWHHSFFGWDDLLIDHLLTPLHEGRLPIRCRPSAWVQRGRPALTGPVRERGDCLRTGSGDEAGVVTGPLDIP